MKNLTLVVCALILCGGSLLCSVGLWASEQSNIFSQIIFGAFFGALELCKLAFFPIAASLFSTRKVAGTLLYFLAFVLLGLSIFATVAFLETGANQNTSSTRKSSHAYLSLKETIASLEAQIKTTNENMSRDLKFDFRGRAAKQSELIAELQSQKLKAIADLRNFEISPDSGVLSIFDKWASSLGITVSKVRLTVYSFLAVFIDICGIACLMLLSVAPKVKQKRKVKQVENNQPKQSTKTSGVSKVDLTEIKEKIIAGEYGSTPKMREIIQSEKVRHPILKQLFISLIDEGVLIKQGKGFALVKA